MSFIDRPATPAFVEQVERLAASGRHAADARLTASPGVSAVVRRLAVAANAGLGQWLMMDAIDEERARSERKSEKYKHALEHGRAEYREAKRVRREAAIRASEEERRTKERKKWRRGFSARKQIARLKGGVKQLIGARHP